MSKLVVAEKPSVARDIAAVIGADEKSGGVLRGNGYIVTSASGHLVQLKDPDDYDEKYRKWNISDLPITPDFEFIPRKAYDKSGKRDPDKESRLLETLEKLSGLMDSSDVDEIIEATDAGREGECIFRYIYNYIGCTKPVKRLWISSMTEQSIREGFENLKPFADYDNMFAAGFARNKIDWLWGMNLTRLYSNCFGVICSVGRVQTAVVNMIVQQDNDIANFTKKTFFKLKLKNGAEWFDEEDDSFPEKTQAEAVKAKCENRLCTVVSAETKLKKENRPLLFSLTSLQIEANEKLGFTAEHNTTLYRVLNEYGGGTGTRENPYIISYYDQLLRLSEKEASGHFVQIADIKFPANVERKPIDTKEISRGYENKSYDFFVYDGGNFIIKNLRGHGGLFGKISGSTIKNVIIEDADISVADYSNVGIICNEITSYSFESVEGARDYATGNSKIINCSVVKSKIDGGNAENVGGICGYGGMISDCLASEIAINGGGNVGGIVGNACSVTGCLANGVTADGGIKSAGGIAGTAYGTRIYDNGGEYYYSGGNIIGCGVRTFISTAENSGGIIGTATSDAKSTYIKSCYAANIYLNGINNGGVAGADGEKEPHRIAYCLIDSANGYPVIGGDNVRSISKTMVLSVPGDSGLTVEGVLSVLNASGSGYNQWKLDKSVNDGYPYTKAISSR